MGVGRIILNYGSCFMGIQLAMEPGLFKVEIQSDSREVIDLVNDDHNDGFAMVNLNESLSLHS